MDRNLLLSRLVNQEKVWDVVVIGGGATGLGCAVDAAARGYEVALFEREDFAKCTSSRSTKLVHGGVRYLQKMEMDVAILLHSELDLLLNFFYFLHNFPIR